MSASRDVIATSRLLHQTIPERPAGCMPRCVLRVWSIDIAHTHLSLHLCWFRAVACHRNASRMHAKKIHDAVWRFRHLRRLAVVDLLAPVMRRDAAEAGGKRR
jgi:hypothetical protein